MEVVVGDDGYRLALLAAVLPSRAPLCPAGHLPLKGGDQQVVGDQLPLKPFTRKTAVVAGVFAAR